MANDDSAPWEDFAEDGLTPDKLTYYYPETEEATLAAGLNPKIEGGIHGAGRFSKLDLRNHTLEKYDENDPNSVVAVAMPGEPTGVQFPLKVRGKTVRAWNVDTGGGLVPGQVDVATADPELAKSGRQSIDLYPDQPPWEDFKGATTVDTKPPWEDYYTGEVQKAKPIDVHAPSPATTIPNLPKEESDLVAQIEKNRIEAGKQGVFPKAQRVTSADKQPPEQVPERPPQSFLAQTANYLRHVHIANNEEYAKQIDVLPPSGRGITEPLYQPKRLEAGQDVPDLDPITMKPTGSMHKASAVEAALHNTVNGMLSGASSVQGLFEMLPPVFLAETIYGAPTLWRRIKDAEKTPPWSQERWEIGLQAAGTLATLGLMGDASIKSLLKGAPKEVTDRLGGERYATEPDKTPGAVPPVQRKPVVSETKVETKAGDTRETSSEKQKLTEKVNEGLTDLEKSATAKVNDLLTQYAESLANDDVIAPSDERIAQALAFEKMSRRKFETTMREAGIPPDHQDRLIKSLYPPVSAPPHKEQEGAVRTDQYPAFLTDYWKASTSKVKSEAGTAFTPERLEKAKLTRPQVIEAINQAVKRGVPEDFILDRSKYTATNLAYDDIVNEPGTETPKLRPGEKGTSEEPSAEEQAQMQREYENELLAEAEEYMSSGGDDIVSAVQKFGGLPDVGSPHEAELTGELLALREEFTKRAPGRRGPKFFGKIGDVSYKDLFKKNAGSMDVLMQNLQGSGFDVNTREDVIDLLRQQLRTGKKIYGMETRADLDDPLSAARSEMFGHDEAMRAAAMNKASGLEASAPGSLGISPFDPFGKDLGKMIGTVTSTFAKAAKQVRALFSPVNASPEAGEMARMIRASEGEQYRQVEIAATAVKKLAKLMNRLNNRTNLDFIDKMEKGQPVDPRFQSYIPIRSKAYSDRIAMVRKLDPNAMQTVLQYYFPHIWTPESIERVSKGNINASNPWAAIFGKRPLTGPKGFLKQRTIPDTMTGVALGLEPVTFNPIELDLLKLREMDRYIAGKKLWEEIKDRGLNKFVRAGTKPPVGYTKINDPLARVLAPKDWEIIDAQGRKMPGQKLLGHYYLPDDIARVLNNHLSAGLRGIAAYDALRLVGNTMNQVQLGISLYHAMFTMIDGLASTGSLGLEQMARSGLNPKQLAVGAFNFFRPILQAPVGGSLIENIWRGSKFLKEYSQPGSTNARMARIVDAAVKGNVPIRMDAYYGTGASESFVNAIRKANYGGALLRLPFAVFDWSAKPLMEFIVPRMKMGINAQRIEYELSKLPLDASEDAVRKVVGRVIDSTDNRMGQMKYDNIFWHKTLKDSLMLSVRSVGWNLGDIRELGGGGLDFITTPSRMYKNIAHPEVGANPVMTTRMAYLIYYPFIVGSLGAMYQYLKTGEGPKSLEDYFMPRTGRMNPDGSAERVMLPTYMKDIAPLAVAGARHGVVGFTSRLGKSAQNKIHPLFSTLAQMMQNKDYYGTEIRNENDNLVQTVKKEAAFILKQFKPFSVTGFQRRVGGPEAKAEAIGGIMPASQELTMSPAAEIAHKYFIAQLPQGARTQEEAATSQLKHDTLEKIRKGDYSDLQKAVSSGKLSQRAALNLAKRAQLQPLQYQVKRLTPDQAMEVWRVASKEERVQIGSILRTKIERSKTLSRDKMIGFLNELSQ